jgi:hypothetical protein
VAWDNDLLVSIQSTLNNYCVIIAVATAVAGPIFGLFGLRLHELILTAGYRFMAVGALISFAAMPAVFLAQLIADPRLSLSNHRTQAEWGLLIGLLMLVAGGIGLACWSKKGTVGGND